MILSVYKLFYNYKILYKKSIDHSQAYIDLGL